MKHAIFNAEGMPAAFYDDAIHSEIPDGAVEITDQQWRELIGNQGRRKWQGGNLVLHEPPAAAEPVPEWIDFRQAVIGLGPRHVGFIDDDAARAWARREALPAPVAQAIAQLPAEQQVDAEITALTMTRVYRDDPLIALAAAVLMPDATQEERDAQRDAYFRAWALI